MEILVILFIVVAILIVAVGMANGIDNKTKQNVDIAATDRIKAEQSRELQQLENELALEQRAERNALAAEQRRMMVKQQILDIDNRNRLALQTDMRKQGDISLAIEVEEINLQPVPVVTWDWKPFGTAILKIHRNQGTILESAEAVKQHAPLIYLVEADAQGRFEDKEAQAGATYNYYAFAEMVREATRPVEVEKSVPSELGQVVDQQGNVVETILGFEPETYDETMYFNLAYKRVAVDQKLSPFAQKHQELEERKTALRMKEMEADIIEQEEEFGLITDDTKSASENIENMLAQAVSKGRQKAKVKQLVTDKVHNNTELTNQEKDELIEEINKKFGL